MQEQGRRSASPLPARRRAESLVLQQTAEESEEEDSAVPVKTPLLLSRRQTSQG